MDKTKSNKTLSRLVDAMQQRCHLALDIYKKGHYELYYRRSGWNDAQSGRDLRVTLMPGSAAVFLCPICSKVQVRCASHHTKTILTPKLARICWFFWTKVNPLIIGLLSHYQETNLPFCCIFWPHTYKQLITYFIRLHPEGVNACFKNS